MRAGIKHAIGCIAAIAFPTALCAQTSSSGDCPTGTDPAICALLKPLAPGVGPSYGNGGGIKNYRIPDANELGNPSFSATTKLYQSGGAPVQ